MSPNRLTRRIGMSAERSDPLRARNVAEGLSLLIRRTGKTQEELSWMLADRGTPLAAPTISAWVTGKSPSPDGLRVRLNLLSEILGEEQETLYRQFGFFLLRPR
jgi:hypothetical protein